MFWKKRRLAEDLERKLQTEKILMLSKKLDAYLEEQVEDRRYLRGWLNDMHNRIAQTCGTVSSIELELVMQRKGCTDNDFPGKKDLT